LKSIPEHNVFTLNVNHFYILLFISNKGWKKPKGRGFIKPGKDETRPGKHDQGAPGDCFVYFDLEVISSILNNVA
jgi:hypothetical protein